MTSDRIAIRGKMAKAIFMGAMALIGSSGQSVAADLVASFSNVSDGKFSVEALAPKEKIREYAICKAVWFAEKKKAPSLSLGNPMYLDPNTVKGLPGFPKEIPDDWIVVNATVYLTEPNPNNNPSVNVPEYAAQCRRAWDWYR
jgi:hypothetical protein